MKDLSHLKSIFKFLPGDKVETIVGDLGFVETCAIEAEGRVKYYVVWKGGNGRWFYEDTLTAGWNTSKSVSGFKTK
ncbi:MAG: hypothetical protein AB1553_01920 [Nitrospirota bacterium]